MASPDPEKLEKLAAEIAETLGYELFSDDDEPSDDPEIRRYRQLIQLIEMELKSELLAVNIGLLDTDTNDTPVPDAIPVLPEIIFVPSEKPAVPDSSQNAIIGSKILENPTQSAQKKPVSAKIRIIEHEAGSTNPEAGFFSSLSLPSASVLAVAIPLIFLAGFVAAEFWSSGSIPFVSVVNEQKTANPKNPGQTKAAKAFFLLGKNELEKKNSRAARESFRMALSLEPDNLKYQEAFREIELQSKLGKNKKNRP